MELRFFLGLGLGFAIQGSVIKGLLICMLGWNGGLKVMGFWGLMSVVREQGQCRPFMAGNATEFRLRGSLGSHTG